MIQRTEAVCRCGHRRDAHTHYRPGTDCSVCGPQLCARFRRPRAARLRRLLSAVRFRGHGRQPHPRAT